MTFPSDARRLLGEIGFSFYPNAGGFGSIFVPVRRWEDAKWDRDSGVKIQIAWSLGAWSRMPLEPSGNSKGRQEYSYFEGGSKVKIDGLPATRFYLWIVSIDGLIMMIDGKGWWIAGGRAVAGNDYWQGVLGARSPRYLRGLGLGTQVFLGALTQQQGF